MEKLMEKLMDKLAVLYVWFLLITSQIFELVLFCNLGDASSPIGFKILLAILLYLGSFICFCLGPVLAFMSFILIPASLLFAMPIWILYAIGTLLGDTGWIHEVGYSYSFAVSLLCSLVGVIHIYVVAHGLAITGFFDD